MTYSLPESHLRQRFPLITLFILLASLLSACSDDNNSGNPVPAATIDGPLEGSATIISTFFDLDTLGYEQAEYFVSGTANAYSNVNELASDGLWQVEATAQADYLTRIVVIRPSDAADFNGSVMVEWLNVSAGFGTGPDWGMTHTELIRQGYAWVGVSAQKIGVDALINGRVDALLGTDTRDRYQQLVHPGDSFSYDIYSQVGQAIKSPGDIAPLGELVAERLIAAGESQSASRMVSYINALAPIHNVYDGYFIHSRLGSSAPLAQDPQVVIASPGIIRVRDDLQTPVMMLQTESDLFLLGSYPDRQQDSPLFRLWEVAGTAHADLYTFLDNRFDTGSNPAVSAIVENAAPIPGIIDCDKPVNAGPQHFVANAAIAALNQWLIDGTEPAIADRLTVSDDAASFVVDGLGNVEGGIRTPYVDVPIAILSGEGQSGSGFCFLSGTTELFDLATLGSLYADNNTYIAAVNAATDAAVASGFILPADALLIKSYVAGTDVFNP